MAVKAMQLGAIELLEKPVDPDVLRDRVAKALQSESLNHQQHLELAEIKACYESLSPREREVLRLLVAGKQPKIIANILGTAQSTVRIQRQSILKKMRVDNVYDLILFADQIDQIDHTVVSGNRVGSEGKMCDRANVEPARVGHSQIFNREPNDA